MSFFANLVFDNLIDESGDIPLSLFLVRSRNIPKFCDALGSTFYLTKKDVEGNIYKIEEAIKKLPMNATVKQMLEFELKMKVAKNSNSGTVGLLWLRRALWFICTMVQNLVRDERAGAEDAMKNMTKEAYERTLRPHHNAIIAPMIKTCFAALPRRSVLLKSLSNDVPMEQQLQDMQYSVDTLTPVLNHLKQSLIEYKQITDPSKD